MPVKPEVKSFLIADMVIQEKGTNKWSAIGLFDRIAAVKFPCLHPSLGIYVRLSDAEGEYAVRVELADSRGQKLAVFEGLKIKVASRLDSLDLGIRTRNLPLPQPGRYDFNLYCNDEFVKNFPLVVTRIDETGKEVTGQDQ